MNLNYHNSYYRAFKQFNRHTIHVLHENNALICKIHHKVQHCFNMYMRILTLKYSDSFGITSSRIILEQGTLASPSLFKHKKTSLWSIFSISIMDLGKMCEIQSWPTTYFAVALFTVVNQWIQRFFVFDFSSLNFIWSKRSLGVKWWFNKSAVSMFRSILLSQIVCVLISLDTLQTTSFVSYQSRPRTYSPDGCVIYTRHHVTSFVKFPGSLR